MTSGFQKKPTLERPIRSEIAAGELQWIGTPPRRAPLAARVLRKSRPSVTEEPAVAIVP